MLAQPPGGPGAYNSERTQRARLFVVLSPLPWHSVAGGPPTARSPSARTRSSLTMSLILTGQTGNLKWLVLFVCSFGPFVRIRPSLASLVFLDRQTSSKGSIGYPVDRWAAIMYSTNLRCW